MTDIDFNRLNDPQRVVLRKTLTRLFTRSRLDMFLREKGYGRLENLVPSGAFDYQVFELIDKLAREGRLNDVMADVRTAYPQAPALEDLDVRFGLTDDVAEGQRVVGGKGLEKMVREAGFADLNLWTNRLSEAGRKVCRISYQVAGGVVRGTGFLVARDLVLTNYHVIEHLLKGKAEAGDVRLSFGYAETADGLSTGDKYWLAQDWIVAHSSYSQADLATDAGLPGAHELDFALLRVEKPAGDAEGRAGKRGWFDLGSVSEPTQTDAIVFVLQHPEGKPLKQSIGVRKRSSTPLRLRYDADTERGSSGAVVLDQQLDPVALHHAGDPGSKIKAQYNQGIPLTLIRAALETDPEVPRFWRGHALSDPVAATSVAPGTATEDFVTEDPIAEDPAAENSGASDPAPGPADSHISPTVRRLLEQGTPREVARRWRRIAETGTFAEATAITRRMIELTRSYDRTLAAQGYETLGDLYKNRDRHREARRHWSKSLVHYRQLKDQDKIAELQRKLGI